MENKKVAVRSTVNGTVILSLPEMRFSRTWAKKNAVVTIDLDILKEGSYDPGFHSMLTSGLLYIEDMDVKIELGLEPAGAKKPENIIVLTDNQMLNLLKIESFDSFKETIGILSREQIDGVVDFAIEKKLVDMDKLAYLKKISGKDILKTIQLEEDDTPDES